MFVGESINFILGIAALILGGNWLVGGASTLARWLKVPAIIVGLTVVSIGTSLPELVVNIQSVLAGSTELAFSTVIGSNISNILLVLAIGALIVPIKLDYNTRTKDLPYALLATLVIIIFVSDIFLDGSAVNALTRVESFALLGFFAVFLSYMYFTTLANSHKEITEDIAQKKILRSIIIIPLGILFLALGGDITVKSSINLATIFGVSERIIGLTIVAIGTSLPELVTVVIAALKGKVDLLIGNIIGSNIFNIFFVLGITGLIRPLQIESIPIIDFGFMLGAVFLLIGSLYIGEKHTIKKYQALLMIVAYVSYVVIITVIS